MEIANSGKQKQPKLPVITAIRGSLDIQQSEIAYKLAESLNYPLIDERDINQMILDHEILSSTLSTATTTSASISRDLPFKIASQISSTLLLLKFPVIINTSISETYHLDHLLQLAISREALLIIIDCSSYQIDLVLEDYYWVKHFSISMETFDVEEFIPKILEAVENYEVASLQDPEDGGEADSSQDSMSIPVQSLLHEFSFTEEPVMASNEHHCSHCQEVISGPSYQCIECDEFILHKSCAELPADSEAISKYYPFYINPNPSNFNFPETHKCRVCASYSSECSSCLLQTHIRCGILPTICRYQRHEHPLSFVIMPFWFDYEYKCYDCGEYGKFIGYKCHGCCLDLHPSCAISKTKSGGVDEDANSDAEMVPKIIGGEPTEPALQEAYALRRDMIVKAVGAGYAGHK